MRTTGRHDDEDDKSTNRHGDDDGGGGGHFCSRDQENSNATAAIHFFASVELAVAIR